MKNLGDQDNPALQQVEDTRHGAATHTSHSAADGPIFESFVTRRLVLPAGPLFTWMTVLFLTLTLSLAGKEVADRVYPPSPSVVDVTKAPYHAKGDGVTDDTAALQQAINEHTGRHHVLYFPKGTYVISSTLTWPKKWNGRDNWGKTFLCGQNRDKAVLRLKDGTFTDARKPQAMMWCGGFGSADWFHNYVENLTFDVGNGNPGATALQFYSNNSGAVRDCRFIAPEGSGVVGLDLGHRDMNGPLLVRNCEVSGFNVGIQSSRAVNGQTFEHIRLRGQKHFGIDNAGQSLSIRDLDFEGAAPGVRSYGALALLDAKIAGLGAAAKVPAVINYNGGHLFVRDLTTTGYARAIGDVRTPDFMAAYRPGAEGRGGTEGPVVKEYSSAEVTRLFDAPAESPRLPIKDPPEVPWDDPHTWANVDAFGADPTGKADSSAAVQKAMDSGATTVFLPGSYSLKSTVIVRGKVRRIVGVGGMVDYEAKVRPDFRIAEGESPVVCVEHFAYVHGGIEIDTKRTLYFRSVADCDLTFTAAAEGGELFMEDFVTHGLALRKQRAWARQLNIENEGVHLKNDASHLWVLGYKTERGGTLLHTLGGGRSEILGGFSYTTTAGKLAPMFVNDDASVWTFFREVCYNGDPFTTLVQETRGGETQTIERGKGSTAPYSGISPAR